MAEPGPRWPNLFLVGAAKAGTTSLYDALARNPAIFMSPVKEPHYFSRIEPSPERRAFFPHVADEASYLELFDGAADEELLGEASTSYLWEPGTAERIREQSPRARILIMLRDPVERAYSQYWNDVREGLETAVVPRCPSRGAAVRAGGVGRLLPIHRLWPLCGPGASVPGSVRRPGPRLAVRGLVADEARTTAGILRAPGPRAAGAAPRRAAMNPVSMPRNRLGGALLGSGRVRRIARATVPRRLRARARGALLERSARPPMDPAARDLLSEVFAPDVERLGRLLAGPFRGSGGGRSAAD